jgi:hypothetical protein
VEHQLVTIECIDWFGPLARFNGAAVAAVGASETVTARINRILDAYGTAGVATVERDIGTSGGRPGAAPTRSRNRPRGPRSFPAAAARRRH